MLVEKNSTAFGCIEMNVWGLKAPDKGIKVLKESDAYSVTGRTL